MSSIVKWEERKTGILPPPGGILTSIKTDAPEGRRLLYKAMMSSEMHFDDLVKERIRVKHVAAHWIERPDMETGELKTALRVVVVTDDGIIISGGSKRIYDCLMAACAMSGREPPFDPPLTFTIKSDPRKDGPGHSLWLDWEE